MPPRETEERSATGDGRLFPGYAASVSCLRAFSGGAYAKGGQRFELRSWSVARPSYGLGGHERCSPLLRSCSLEVSIALSPRRASSVPQP
mmetsp:Transcript_45948/g.120445  ORF Transcript_45948/g.120445 Transcript_45948/m.120445 type:complete len:90 (+) Transcript_45948:210-479(+)